MSSAILDHLARLAPTAFPAGATLITEGLPASRLYVLASGELQVFRAEMPVATIREPGAVVGEIAALLGRPASATVRAQNAVTAWAVDEPARFLEDNPAVLLEVARLLAARLDATTAFLAQSRHRFADTEDLEFLEDVFALLGQPAAPRHDAVLES